MIYLDALYHTVRNYPGGAESLAPRLGMSANVLRNKVNPNQATHHIRLDEAMSIMALTGDARTLHTMAAELGYVVVPDLGAGEFSNEDLLIKFNQLYQQIGQIAAETNQFLADGHLDQGESRKLHLSVLRAVGHLHELHRQVVVAFGG